MTIANAGFEAVSVLIAGDVVPNGRTMDAFASHKAEALFRDLIPEIQGADYSIVNLECPIVDRKASAIKKNGPCLCTTIDTVTTLKEAGFDCVTLANNHFRDFGQTGVEDTLSVLRQSEMDYVGAGATKEEARRILFREIGHKMVAFINVCEHEYSVATRNYGGSNPLDLLDVDEDIVLAQSKADYVVVIVHGGKEHIQLPMPRMKRWYRHFIKTGADAVVNHHQHCFSGYEICDGKPIFYGLGNFCFDKYELHKKQVSMWNYGFCVKLLLGEHIGFEMIPYLQCGATPCVQQTEYAAFEREVEALNAIIADDSILEDRITAFALKYEKPFLASFWPIGNKYLKALYTRGFLGHVFDQRGLLNIQNSIECESHLDIKRTLIRRLLDK